MSDSRLMIQHDRVALRRQHIADSAEEYSAGTATLADNRPALVHPMLASPSVTAHLVNVQRISHMQRTHGNAHVQRMIVASRQPSSVLQRCGGKPCACNNHSTETADEQLETSVQRKPLSEDERKLDLTSAQFADSERLQSAFDNNPPMRKGESGDAVKRFQQALLAQGAEMPVSTANGEPDGIFGNETERVVRQFQSDNELSADGIAGRQTLGELDNRNDGAEPFRPAKKKKRTKRKTPPVPPQPVLTDQQKIDQAQAQRQSTLVFAQFSLLGLQLGVQAGLSNDELNKSFGPSVAAVAKWLNLKLGAPDYVEKLRKAQELMGKNMALSTTPPVIHQLPTGPASSKGKVECAVPAHAWSYTGEPAVGVMCCDPFFNTDGPLCRRDVLTHEYFHLVGLHHGEGSDGKSTSRDKMTTDQALNSADNMAQLVSDLNATGTDACPSR